MEINPLFYYQELLYCCHLHVNGTTGSYYKYYQKMQNSFLKMVSINVCEININIKYIANRRLICDVEYFTFCEQFYLFFLISIFIVKLKII